MRNFIWPSSSPTYGRMRPGPVDGVVVEARDDVPVTVIDRLAGGLAVVDDHVEPVGAGGRADGPAEPGQERAGGRGDGVGELAQVGVMGPGHEQGVAAIDRIDVEEGDGLGRLEYPGRRDLAVDDLAEDAVRIVRSHGSRRLRPVAANQAWFDAWMTIGSVSIRLSMSSRTQPCNLVDQPPRDEPTTAGLAGALIVSFSPRSAITAMGAASPWRTLASL